MNKILLIINREYFSRVKKKSFLLVTFLLPLFFIGVYTAIIILTKQSFDNQHATVQVLDESGFIQEKLADNENIKFLNATAGISEEKKKLTTAKEETYLLIIPKNITDNHTVELFSSAKVGFSTQEQISTQIENILRNYQLEAAGINVKILESINPNVQITSKELTAEGEKDSNTAAAMGIAITLSIVIYISLFLYGSQVMRGIIEEKNNRIVEVIISSVKPFQLMMGKIIGIGLVGLTQFILWILLSSGLMAAAGTFTGAENPAQSAMEQVDGTAPKKMQADQERSGLAGEFMKAMDTINFAKIITCFLIFFIGGYLLYSALFAAVGSAVDTETETQQFMFPITMPLLFTYILSFGVLINNPHGSLAVWLSMIPFTSPVAMLVRIPFGVPDWQIAISVILLIGGFLLTSWVAGRIYRVGILMYGKKASYKELVKWFRYRG